MAHLVIRDWQRIITPAQLIAELELIRKGIKMDAKTKGNIIRNATKAVEDMRLVDWDANPGASKLTVETVIQKVEEALARRTSTRKAS